MDYLNSMLPEVKFASCLDDLLTFRRLVAYKLKVSCIKAKNFSEPMFFSLDLMSKKTVTKVRLSPCLVA